MFITSYIFF